MTIEDYQKFVQRCASSSYNKEIAVLGLVGEVGELADVIKKTHIYSDISRFENKYGMSVKEKIKDEVGDILWQLVNVLNQYELTAEEVIANNVEKLLVRHGGYTTAADGGGNRE